MESAAGASCSSTALAETGSQCSRSSASILQSSVSQDLLASLVTRERCIFTTDLLPGTLESGHSSTWIRWSAIKITENSFNRITWSILSNYTLSVHGFPAFQEVLLEVLKLQALALAWNMYVLKRERNLVETDLVDFLVVIVFKYPNPWLQQMGYSSHLSFGPCFVFHIPFLSGHDCSQGKISVRLWWSCWNCFC